MEGFVIQPLVRHYLPADFQLQGLSSLQPYLQELETRPIPDLEALHRWLADLSELEAAVDEDISWRQIRVSQDTSHQAYAAAYQQFYREIAPVLQQYAQRFRQKIISCPFTDQLGATYFPFLRQTRNAVALFREENIPLQNELALLQRKYGQITGSLTVVVQGQELTLPQAARFLEQSDRNLREEAFIRIANARLSIQQELDELFDQLLEKRHQMAQQAGYPDYRAYRFRELNRFDYTPADCEAFHEAISRYILPLVARVQEKKQTELGLSALQPWDTDAMPPGVEPLRPFTQAEELVQKTLACLERVDPRFAWVLAEMHRQGHLDLESRKHKAPGGFNCALAEKGLPFIFMNASGQWQDVVTLIHETGHAVHAVLAHSLPLQAFKEYPMEIAELASMSMELFSMHAWEVYVHHPEELRLARRQQLERIITLLPWIATIDAFQHWLYTHPGHSREARRQAWLQVLDRFSTGKVDWSGWEHYRAISWQKQLHLFEVPFYYIEYGIAQLGAVALRRAFTRDPQQTLQRYMQALQLGNTRTLPELYREAGIAFDFSPEYVRSLAGFLETELEEIYAHH
ncbi:MAG: M3 family oligoendopeptidase [Thermoflavifilum sp.]|nr:M3 family oligoendopeptidase [Thermoflavifilum sp.]